MCEHIIEEKLTYPLALEHASPSMKQPMSPLRKSSASCNYKNASRTTARSRFFPSFMFDYVLATALLVSHAIASCLVLRVSLRLVSSRLAASSLAGPPGQANLRGQVGWAPGWVNGPAGPAGLAGPKNREGPQREFGVSDQAKLASGSETDQSRT